MNVIVPDIKIMTIIEINAVSANRVTKSILSYLFIFYYINGIKIHSSSSKTLPAGLQIKTLTYSIINFSFSIAEFQIRNRL